MPDLIDCQVLPSCLSSQAQPLQFGGAFPMKRICLAISFIVPLALAADPPRKPPQFIERGTLPTRVHVFEDYETEIEKRWWLRGTPVAENLAPSLSSIANRRACRATATKDSAEKCVMFNPVPGPPMSGNTRLSFRYRLTGADSLRVQLFSLTKNDNRHLVLSGLPQGTWQDAAADMTAARRNDGSDDRLAADERIDDIQFHVAPEADLLIDDIVLYEAAPARETAAFPRRIIFTGWFDTGKQGAEWPGDFEIVEHEKPLTWKCAKSVANAATGEPWIRVGLRGARPLGETNRLRFRYKLTGSGPLKIVLANSATGQTWGASAPDLRTGEWAETAIDFSKATTVAPADELRFMIPKGAELLVDDVLLFEPG